MQSDIAQHLFSIKHVLGQICLLCVMGFLFSVFPFCAIKELQVSLAMLHLCLLCLKTGLLKSIVKSRGTQGAKNV